MKHGYLIISPGKYNLRVLADLVRKMRKFVTSSKEIFIVFNAVFR